MVMRFYVFCIGFIPYSEAAKIGAFYFKNLFMQDEMQDEKKEEDHF